LRIDFANSEVQDILNKTFRASIGSKNVQTAADINTNIQELNVKRKQIDASGLDFDVGSLAGRINDIDSQIIELSDKILDGGIFREDVSVEEREEIL
jgi:hypothetical protein